MSRNAESPTPRSTIITACRAATSPTCAEAADDAIKRRRRRSAGVTPPRRDVMETYWKGVLMVPERTLIVGRLDNVIVGSAQLVRPTKNNEAQAHSGAADHQLHGAVGARPRRSRRMITESGRRTTRARSGMTVLNLDVRETQEAAAITLYRSLGLSRRSGGTQLYRGSNGQASSPASISGKT